MAEQLAAVRVVSHASTSQGQTSPRSPTLSCADMILPEGSLRSFSPSPYMERPPSPPSMLYSHSNRSAAAITLASVPQHLHPSQKEQSPPLSSSSSRSTLRIATNMGGSDSNSSPRGGDARNHDTGLASSPTIADGYSGHTYEKGRTSDSSSSVHSGDLEDMNWPAFDGSSGALHLDDSGVVLEAGEEQEEDDQFPLASPCDDDMENDKWLEAQSDADIDAYSSAALSRRAEIILANAKKRLNVMEGNLRGARQSLVVSPTLANMKTDSAISHQLSAARDRDRKLYAGVGPIPPRFRQYYTSPLSTSGPGSPGHNRGMSDVSSFSPTYPSRTAKKRASSAMGVASGPWSPENFGIGRFPLRESRSFEVVGNLPHEEKVPSLPSHDSRGSKSPPNALETLPEDEDDTQTPQRPQLLRRSSSTTGDLRTQMQDLKGRISSLKLKAQEDNMRRRSMQSLRTPSPFTCAETWYAAGNAYKSGESPVAADAGVGIKTESPVRKALYEDDTSDASIPKDTLVEKPIKHSETTVEMDGEVLTEGPSHLPSDDFHRAHDFNFASYDGDPSPTSESSDEEEFDFNDFVSLEDEDPEEEQGGGSVYEDAVYEIPIAERHEDRVDAFDYEHFFLHSAMGSYSSTSRRSSSSSADSVATTRPATAQYAEETPKRISMHQRNPSVDSVSTMASFATAAEEQSDDEDENEQMDQFSHQLLSNQQGAPTHLLAQKSLSSLRADSAINMRKAASSPGQASRSQSRGSSPGGDLASGLQTSKIYSILLEPATPQEPRLALNEEEKQLIYSLAASFQQVCARLQSTAGDQYERKEWRRRLDEARRVLNGEESDLDGF